MIAVIRAAHPNTEIVVQTMNACVNKAGRGREHKSARPRLTKYMEMYKETGLEKNVFVVDNYKNWQKLLYWERKVFDKLVPDGIHPTLEGYRVVVLPELRKVLEGPQEGIGDEEETPEEPKPDQQSSEEQNSSNQAPDKLNSNEEDSDEEDSDEEDSDEEDSEEETEMETSSSNPPSFP